MDANRRTLAAIFDHTIQFSVPLFQRPYVWNEESEWFPLWESVALLIDRKLAGAAVKPHFLGALVLDQLPVATGSVEKRQIIDGQQRLTTFQLLLAAARDCAAAHGLTDYSAAFQKLVENDLPLSKNPDERFKVWPTNFDREPFRQTLAARSPDEVKAVFKTSRTRSRVGHRIPDAYLFFFETLNDFVAEDPKTEPAEDFSAIYHVLRDQLLFVVIDLDERDDAQMIFETLNALGAPLLPADLIKNFLFHRAQRERAEIESLYNQYWNRFDEDPFWREEVREGRLKRPRIDIFLRHYLTLVTNDEVQVNHLFATFRDFVNRSQLTSEVHLVQLVEYAEVFRRLHTFTPETPEGSFLARLEVMQTSTVLPFLMELFRLSEAESTDNRRQILRDLESYLVRRMVCRLTTKNYNRLFLDLVQRLRQAESFDAEKVRSFLTGGEGDSRRWPSDEEFEEHWTTESFYRSLAQSRVRMILEALELALRGPRTESLQFNKKLTIEHLMPQKWERHWPLPGEASTERETFRRQSLIHRIGNLALLTDKLNPEVSNGPWSVKREKILRYSVLLLNQKAAHQRSWTEGDIERRTLELLEVASRLWPFGAEEQARSPTTRTRRPAAPPGEVPREAQLIPETEGKERIENPEAPAITAAPGVGRMDHAIATFRQTYPGAFTDPLYLEEERDYKWHAHESCIQTLGDGQTMLGAGHLEDLVRGASSVEAKTNLLAIFEKAAFRDALKDSQAAARFFEAFFELLVAPGLARDSFERYLHAVESLPQKPGKTSPAKWTIATILPFLADPDRFMFLKPRKTAAFAKRLDFALEYRPELNWRTYERLMEMSDVMLRSLRPHGAKDYIDVQSLIWVIGGAWGT